MADSVRVQFSASIGALIKSVEDAKSAIESVRESTDRVSEGAKSLLEAFGLAFSVEKVNEFINSMAELGERTTRTAAILGEPTEEIGKLDAIAKGSGTSLENLARGLEIFQSNLQKAKSGTSEQAHALQALGLSAKDFVGLPLDQQLDKFADAIARFGDGGTKIAAVRALFGRLGDDLIPVFDKGSKGLRELAEMAERAGTSLRGDTAAAFEETKLKLTELGLSVEGVGIRAFQVLEPAIDAAATAATHFLEGLDFGTVERALKSIGTTVIDVLEKISEFFVGITADFDRLVARMGSFDPKRVALNVLDPNLGDLLLGPEKGLAKTLDEIDALAKERLAKLKETAQQYRDTIASFSTGQPDVTKMLGAGMGGGAPPAKPQVPSFGVEKDAISGQIKALSEQIQTQNQAYQSEVEQINSLAKIHQLTEQEKTDALDAAVRTRVAIVESGDN